MTTTANIHVRDAVLADLPSIMAIEQLAFGDPWTRTMFSAHLQHAKDAFVLAEGADGQAIGYAITRVVDDEAELLNIAVGPDVRRMGAGAILLDTVMRRGVAVGARTMFLEVRISNVAACALYARRGFAPVGRRKGYYRSPREDALVLRAALPSSDVGTKTVPRAAHGLPRRSENSILSPASQLPRQEMI